MIELNHPRELSGGDLSPNWCRLDLRRWLGACILATAASEAACSPYGHVMVANNLAAETNAAQAARCQYISLGDRHLRRLAADELNAARRAARVSATSMQLIDPGVLRQGQHQSLASWHLKFADVRHG